MHFLIARHGGEYRYAAWLREHPTVAWSPIANANRLEPVVEQTLAFMFKPNITADLTFSTRLAEQVTADLIEMPEQLATGAIGCEIEVLCREGRLEGPDDRWARVRRLYRSPELFSFGVPADVFRPQTLKAEIAGWFESQGWHTFGAPRPHRSETVAPHYPRELLVRHGDDWRARHLAPSSFPAFRPGPVITAEQEAKRLSKMPMHKSAVRRAKHQENDARFKAEAAERRALREGAA